MSHERWQLCAICQAATQHALASNRVRSRWEVQRLPAEGAPSLSWHRHHHRRCKLRAATVVWANAYGDRCFLLECGHQTQWVFRGEGRYTPALVEREVESGQINLEQRQRYFLCADVVRESEAHHEP